MGDGFADPFAPMPGEIAVAQLQRFMPPGAGARRNNGPADGPAHRVHLDFNRRIASAVENFTGVDASDGRQF